MVDGEIMVTSKKNVHFSRSLLSRTQIYKMIVGVCKSMILETAIKITLILDDKLWLSIQILFQIFTKVEIKR